MTLLAMACTLGLTWSGAVASDSASVETRAVLSVDTGADTALVIIDSIRRGTTPLTIDSLAPGKHIIRLVNTDLSSWLTGAINDTLQLHAGERRALRYIFDRRVMIITDPSGAVVFAGDSALGNSPLVLSLSSGAPSGAFSVEKQGYERTVVPLPPGRGGIMRAVLKKLWQSEAPEGALVNESTGDRSSLRLYVAGGATLLSGIAAAYFKIRADNRNADFLAHGSPALRDETRRLDTAAAISLLATEIGFGFLTYFLLAD